MYFTDIRNAQWQGGRVKKNQQQNQRSKRASSHSGGEAGPLQIHIDSLSRAKITFGFAQEPLTLTAYQHLTEDK